MNEVEFQKKVMQIASEEIKEHWEFHCDSEGRGPSLLLDYLDGWKAQNDGELPNLRERRVNHLILLEQNLRESLFKYQAQMWVLSTATPFILWLVPTSIEAYTLYALVLWFVASFAFWLRTWQVLNQIRTRL